MQLPCQRVTRLLLLWWKWEMLLGYCAMMKSANPALVFSWSNMPGQDSVNNSPRSQRAPLCRPTYGPWWWLVVQGAWPGVCARGPTYWCQESPGLQDAALLQRLLALAPALPWCTAMLTARSVQKPGEESQGDKHVHMQSLTCTYIRAVWTQNNTIEKLEIFIGVVRNVLLQSIRGAAGKIQWRHQGPEDRLHNLLSHTNRAIANAVLSLAANGL